MTTTTAAVRTQNCYAGSRLLVDVTITDEVRGRVVAAMSTVRWAPGTRTPTWRAGQRRRVVRARPRVPRRAARHRRPRAHQRWSAGGWYVEPTAVDGLAPDARLMREEVFGPVLAIQTSTGDDEALTMADGTDFGLLTCLWTGDVSRTLCAAAAVRTGQVSVNQFADAGVIGFPFAMQNDSGYAHGVGHEALREYTREKGVAVRLG